MTNPPPQITRNFMNAVTPVSQQRWSTAVDVAGHGMAFA
jgi:hypothetical protein